MLLFHSLDNPNVLGKELDIDRYREYEYLQFAPLYIIELFFEFPSVQDDSLTKTHLLQMLAGMIFIHALVLLSLNYLWLRRSLRY
jgi:hypothetical protein